MDSTAKHTAGPYELTLYRTDGLAPEALPKGQWQPDAFLIEEPANQDGTRGRALAEIRVGYGAPLLPEAYSNANLFSAAPDLLEALKEMVALVDDILKKNNIGKMFFGNYARLNEAPMLARQAIAKAEGAK